MRGLYAINPVLLPNYSVIHSENLKTAVSRLYNEGKLERNDRVIAVTDIQNGAHEIPAMEIITIADIL